MKKIDVVRKMLGSRFGRKISRASAHAFAPTNIALCKYWGKRNSELNIPMTSSLSIALGDKGAETHFTCSDTMTITVNQQSIALTSDFAKRLLHFLELFQFKTSFHIDIKTNVPIAAGLASSACGFAACVMALNNLCEWELSAQELSILARLGSGSASRSCWQGFVEWHAGQRDDGMDSFAEPLDDTWPALRVGLILIQTQQKPVSSRDAMQHTVETSALYSQWPEKVAADLMTLKRALMTHDFNSFGKTAEANAMAMHETMLSAWPPINYSLPETVAAMKQVWNLRAQGLPVYFTQDAGPNLKLLFLENDRAHVQQEFPEIEIIQPFK